MQIQARVRAATQLADDVRGYELIASDGSELPAYEAGAHIDLHLPSGAIRQYSLVGDERDRTRYEIAIQLAAGGRGGSAEAFRVLVPGAELGISAPRNHFPLAAGAVRHLFVAGGIGITPIVAMLRQVSRTAMPFCLVYCTRSPARTAFLDFCAKLAARGTVQFHHDNGERGAQFDFGALLADQQAGTHLYCCGPEGMMAAVRNASAGWKPGTVHFEHFSPVASTDKPEGDIPFQVSLLSTGDVLDVPTSSTIIEVLRAHGVQVETSCESGLCGTCKTRYVAGTPDHRDLILDDVEQREFMMICCSRSRGAMLVLDL
jgi:ferredoxin-NADP reductase